MWSWGGVCVEVRGSCKRKYFLPTGRIWDGTQAISLGHRFLYLLTHLDNHTAHFLDLVFGFWINIF